MTQSRSIPPSSFYTVVENNMASIYSLLFPLNTPIRSKSDWPDLREMERKMEKCEEVEEEAFIWMGWVIIDIVFGVRHKDVGGGRDTIAKEGTTIRRGSWDE